MPDLTATEVAVLDAVDHAEIVRDLVELVAIASVDGASEEREAQLWCADRLRDLGLDVDCWEIDIAEAQRQPDFPGMEVDRDSALGCVAVLGSETGETPALALYGHTDVVPPGDLNLWDNRDPFAVFIDGEGRAWGRGTCDMKGGVVASIAAAAAVRRSGVSLARPLAIHTVSGEEDGGFGAYATLRRGHRADACINAEPTSDTIITACAGALTFQLEVPGLAAHGSTRTIGVSAIDKFALIHRALRDLEARRNIDVPPLFEHLDLAWPLSIGTVSSGDWASTVPDRLVATGRYGVRIDELLPDAIHTFENAVAAACADDPWLREHPVTVSWPGGMFAPGSLPDGHELLEQVRRAVNDVTGTAPSPFGGPYGSDLRHYAAVGIPTLQYGPGSFRHAHTVDEQVRLDDVSACARVYALMAVRSCGTTS
ncbi:MAG: ArgE/DapE family deacylase [Nocardioidaceae bacterium]|nr:ArgE/DapE family deacylase [Nocardioidaceae bacterium]